LGSIKTSGQEFSSSIGVGFVRPPGKLHPANTDCKVRQTFSLQSATVISGDIEEVNGRGRDFFRPLRGCGGWAAYFPTAGAVGYDLSPAARAEVSAGIQNVYENKRDTKLTRLKFTLRTECYMIIKPLTVRRPECC